MVRESFDTTAVRFIGNYKSHKTDKVIGVNLALLIFLLMNEELSYFYAWMRKFWAPEIRLKSLAVDGSLFFCPEIGEGRGS